MTDPRIAHGVAWLDMHYPDWRESIDVDRLDLASDCRCVLGQLAHRMIDDQELEAMLDPDDWGFSAFIVGERPGGWTAPVTLSPEQARHYGFTVPMTWPYDYAVIDADFAALTDLWREELTR